MVQNAFFSMGTSCQLRAVRDGASRCQGVLPLPLLLWLVGRRSGRHLDGVRGTTGGEVLGGECGVEALLQAVVGGHAQRALQVGRDRREDVEWLSQLLGLHRRVSQSVQE